MIFNESWKDEGGRLKAETENALRDHLAHQPVTAQNRNGGCKNW
ncbi:hypothetical protein [Desulfobacter hydrogenophilus]|nr:hypothetical protein [Desulfobacter hydrogenophilus]